MHVYLFGQNVLERTNPGFLRHGIPSPMQDNPAVERKQIAGAQEMRLDATEIDDALRLHD
jgi:hypothetical protein